jgi:hypothetical protein
MKTKTTSLEVLKTDRRYEQKPPANQAATSVYQPLSAISGGLPNASPLKAFHFSTRRQASHSSELRGMPSRGLIFHSFSD